MYGEHSEGLVNRTLSSNLQIFLCALVILYLKTFSLSVGVIVEWENVNIFTIKLVLCSYQPGAHFFY